jgi:hypothetical protein
MLKFLPDDALRGQTQTVSIEGQRPLQIINAQGNDRYACFHGGTFPFRLLLLCGDHSFPEVASLLLKQEVGQHTNLCVQEVISSPATVYLQKESSLDLCSLVRCLMKTFRCPLQASLFLRFYTGLTPKTVPSFISSGSGAEQDRR